MWRYDAGRTARSPEKLPASLHLEWTRCYTPRTPVWDDPLNQDLMPYDRIFEPVVADGRMFVAFNDSDKVVALDAATGDELWAFYTDGPVRMPPVAWRGSVYFASDDGCLWCVEAASGKLKWRFQGGPSARKVLGNRRLISAWPARGGPVLRDNCIYFAASIWPFMGTFLYALDAQSGKPVWVNDGTSSQYILQPHNDLSFAGVAPQGGMAATESLLLVPGGRSVPAAFDRRSGELKYFRLADGGKGTGGSLVLASESELFVHTRRRGVLALDLASGDKTKFTCNEPVLAKEGLYTATGDSSKRSVEALDRDKKVIWSVSADGSGDLIAAGDRLYAAGATAISAIQIPQAGREPRIAWSLPVEGQVLRLLAAGGKLFAVTLDGRIMAFGGAAGSAKVLRNTTRALVPSPQDVASAKTILQREGCREGYAVCFGVEDGGLIAALVAGSELHVVGVDRDAEKIDRLRLRFDAAGLYGSRVALMSADPATFQAPPYMANLIVVSPALVAQAANAQVLTRICSSLRPYGGSLWLPSAGRNPQELLAMATAVKIDGIAGKVAGGGLWLVREGPLAGAASWTHQYGDVANSLKSNDLRVRLPLGLLWFGNNSSVDVLPRHGHGPPEQVVGGRLFIEAMDGLIARDVYTGRVLWKVKLRDMGSAGVYFDDSYSETLAVIATQRHIPGANARGTNFVATADAIYATSGSTCKVLEPKTGATMKTFQLPCRAGQQAAPQWAYIGVYQDVLLAGWGFAFFSHDLLEPAKKGAEKGGANSADLVWWSPDGRGPRKKILSPIFVDESASHGLVAFDRHSGKVLWRADARHSFIHNGIVAGGGLVYCLDRLPASVEERLARRGREKPSGYRILALDAKTGKTRWQVAQDVFGTWLGYSEDHDILLLAGAAATDRLPDEAKQGMIAYRGHGGSAVWKRLHIRYSGPCILHHETIFTNADEFSSQGESLPSRALSLLDGTDRTVTNPLTGQPEPWVMPRGKGCNTMTACESMLLFRDGAAGYYDLAGQSGRGNLGGFRSGCTSNLVAADGVLNAPEYTRTCICAYQNQTSLALVYTPDAEVWTVNDYTRHAGQTGRLKRLGINIGAPGERRSAEGTLWLEYPVRSRGPSDALNVVLSGEKPAYFTHHPSWIEAGPLPWVACSGVKNVQTAVVTLMAPDKQPLSRKPAPYTVCLVFSDPDGLAPGERTFDIWLQGSKVQERFDIAKAAGGPRRSVIREFRGISVQDALRVELKPSPGCRAPAVLCGVEVLAEEAPDGSWHQASVTRLDCTHRETKWDPSRWFYCEIHGLLPFRILLAVASGCGDAPRPPPATGPRSRPTRYRCARSLPNCEPWPK